MRISGARAVIECLREQGVDTVFGYPGGMVLPLYDALYAAPDIRNILTVHEQGAAHAADGYARASGRVGVCLATSGPGATNLLTGLAAAFMDSVPVVAITGQVPTKLIGSDSFQEVDIVGMSMAITKHNGQVKKVEQLPAVMRQAFKIARSGRPGPVLVDIPRDVQTAMTDYFPEPVPEPPVWRPEPDTAGLIARAAAAISKARRPVIVAGGGVISAGAHAELQQLADKCRLPVVSTLMGLGAFPASHSQALGLTGLHGHRAANETVHNSDVIIAAGCRFSDRMTSNPVRYASNKLVIHLDIDPAEIAKNVLTHIGLAGDMRQLLRLLIEQVQPGETGPWWSDIETWRRAERETAVAAWGPQALLREIARQTAGKSVIFATDVGQHQMWAAQNLKIEKPRTWLTSGGLGAMGFGLPAAMGAQLAVPDKRLVHIAGDGGMKMTGNELYTIANCNLPVISIVIDNSGLGMIRQMQRLFFQQHYSACNLPAGFDFTAYARSFGITATAVQDEKQFAAALAAALENSRPTVIVAKIDPTEMVRPMLAPDAALNDFVDF